MYTYDINLVLDLRRSQVAHKLYMRKYFKLLNKLSCGLTAVCLTGATAAEVLAQPNTPAAMPPAISYPNYSFFQGLTFLPFPGTIPRPVVNGNISSIFPLVQVPTPGLITAKQPGASAIKKPGAVAVKRKKRLVTPAAEQPVRRRRRIVPNSR